MVQSTTKEGEFIYSSGWHCFKKIIRQEGWRGFFTGFGANLVRGFGGALLLVGYDEVQALLGLALPAAEA